VSAVQEIVAGFIGTFKDFPPRPKPAKFNAHDVTGKLKRASIDLQPADAEQVQSRPEG
jgi:hypothetical protein